MKTSVIGYPRVGALRELKFASEHYFRRETTQAQLEEVAKTLRAGYWRRQYEHGIDFIPSNDFSFYDNTLDTAFLLNIIPKRSRSDLAILGALKENNFRTEVSPGVYDIHSPRVPSVEEIKTAICELPERIPAAKLWINPDCGLKTRGNAETKSSLENLVEAAKEVRYENN